MSYGEGGICRIQYRPHGLREADMHMRIVRCQLAVGHEGDHEETDTGSRWPQGVADLIGIAPDFTDGLSTEEYMRALRCGGYDECKAIEVQRDKWERRCIDLGVAAALLLKWAKPWRAQWDKPGRYISPEAEELRDALTAFDTELARIDAAVTS